MRWDNDHRIVESKGTVRFAKGKAASELTYVDGKIHQFSVHSDQLPSDWFQGPADTSLYRDRGRRFLEVFTAGDFETSRQMMHNMIADKVDNAELQNILQQVVDRAGKIEGIRPVKEEFQIRENGQWLVATFTVDGSQRDLAATVSFQFAGLKAHLLAFHFELPPPE